MSGILPADDQEFFFSAPTINEDDWFSSSPRKPLARGFLIAIAVSITIHVVIFQFSIPQRPLENTSSPNQSIHITLDYVVPLAPQLAEPEATLQENIEPEVIVKKIVPLSEVDAVVDVESLEILPRATTRKDLETIVSQQNKYRDDYLRSLTFEPAVEHSGDSPNAKQFGNVFDPRLRARLQSNSMGVVKQQATGPVAFTDIHGSTIVELDSGLCMEASSAAIGQPTNWYMTACAGKLSESEAMMERVNSEVRSRRLR